MGWDKVGQDVTRGPLGLFKWLAIGAVLFFILFGALSALGLIGGTVVQREVFRNSFQYQAGMEQRGAILEANMAELDMLIQQNPSQRSDLEAQKSFIRAQLRAITINQ